MKMKEKTKRQVGVSFVWMRNHSTISFLGLWEQIHNPNFKPNEFDRFKAESGDNAFTLTPQQWIKATDAVKEFLITPMLSPQEVPKIERLKILREKAYRQLELLKKNQDTIEALKKNLIEDTEANS